MLCHKSDIEVFGYAIYSLEPNRRSALIENINYAILSAHLMQPQPNFTEHEQPQPPTYAPQEPPQESESINSPRL